MGREEILEKINKELEKGINNESQVVYILSRIRKFLETNKQKGKYKYLNFYCNWILHSKLDEKRTTSFLHDMFEQSIDWNEDIKKIAEKIKSGHKNFFKLSNLKSDLKEFFKKYNLKNDVLDRNWISFSIILLDIIKECPIIFTSDKIYSLELLKEKEKVYCYKFHLNGYKYAPIIKLKFKRKNHQGV